MSELVVFPSLPAYAQTVPSIGSTIGTNANIVLAEGSVTASASVAGTVATGLVKGMSGEVTGPDGSKIPVTVSRIAQPAQAGDNAAVALVPSKSSIPQSWLGKQTLAVITLSNASANALIVPSSAIVTAGHGTAHVLKQSKDGTFKEVAVTELGSLAGRSAVKPLSTDGLAAGDQVKVG